MKTLNKYDKKLMLVLALASMICILLMMQRGHLFGSNTDWLTQHIAFPQFLREQFYETGNLFPSFMKNLGAGQNIYNISYYGFLRPDVLISLALPFVHVKTVIVGYMIVTSILGCLFLYYWLRSKAYSSWVCTLVSFLYILSTPVLFHAHRHIMFVNFLPWLILALIGIDRLVLTGKLNLFIFSIIMIVLSSYYYSLAAGAVCLIYLVVQVKQADPIRSSKKPFGRFILAGVIALATTAILWLPTGLSILEHSRPGTETSLIDLIRPADPSSFFYSPYGIGLTVLAWIVLWMQVSRKKYSVLSIILLALAIFPIFSYILNLGLYARPKILIAFLPLIFLVMAESFSSVKAFTKKQWIWFIIGMSLPLLFPIFAAHTKPFILVFLLEVFVILAVYFMAQRKSFKPAILLLIFPLIAVFTINSKEEYAPREVYTATYNSSHRAMVERHLDKNYRFSNLYDTKTTINGVSAIKMNKNSIYSSIVHEDYRNFFFDIMKNPNPYRNVLMMSDQANSFFLQKMSSRYIYTDDDFVYGYKPIDQDKNGYLMENENIFPLAYATNQLMSEDDFGKLSYPENLDAIYNNSVVKNAPSTKFKSNMVEVKPDMSITSKTDKLTASKTDSGFSINSKGDNDGQLHIKGIGKDKVLLLSFKLTNIKKPSKDVFVEIDGITNKLSGTAAPYPNGNKDFYYQLSGQGDLNNLKATFSNGDYDISKIKCYTYDKSLLDQAPNKVDPVFSDSMLPDTIVSGDVLVKNDGYLITNYNYQKGYQVFLDGKKIPYEKVNTAFLGFPIDSGQHHVEVKFDPPGRDLAIMLSLGGLVAWAIYIGVPLFRKRSSNAS